MEKFSFICLLSSKAKSWSEQTNVVSKLLQSHETDLSIAVQLLDCTIADLSAYREHFEQHRACGGLARPLRTLGRER
ncbi:Hypothetical protein FKW44_016489 [Caligus rogercresseyi]|uniref:Uncharacterized protein n=1 Tax=Caligus rogercresseyi TaxID=217165 RepID=A0A7T8K1E0_CALRO|nr:Hypothetical protein FKW44_016489 [Caligus rogercresseyi]